MAVKLNDDFLNDMNSEIADIVPKLEKYRKVLEGVKENLELNAKTIGEANKEQPAWYAYYDERRIELDKFQKQVESCVSAIKGKLWTTMQKTNQYSASAKDLEHEIECNEYYRTFYKIQLEVEELYKMYYSVVKAFEQRGYVLRNLTDLRVHSIDNDIL